MADINGKHEWTEASWKKSLYAIFDLAIGDPAFRESCIKNPAIAFKQVAGHELPDFVDVTFDASQDAASIPDFKDAFIKRKPVIVKLPATKTVHTVVSK